MSKNSPPRVYVRSVENDDEIEVLPRSGVWAALDGPWGEYSINGFDVVASNGRHELSYEPLREPEYLCTINCKTFGQGKVSRDLMAIKWSDGTVWHRGPEAVSTDRQISPGGGFSMKFSQAPPPVCVWYASDTEYPTQQEFQLNAHASESLSRSTSSCAASHSESSSRLPNQSCTPRTCTPGTCSSSVDADNTDPSEVVCPLDTNCTIFDLPRKYPHEILGVDKQESAEIAREAGEEKVKAGHIPKDSLERVLKTFNNVQLYDVDGMWPHEFLLWIPYDAQPDVIENAVQAVCDWNMDGGKSSVLKAKSAKARLLMQRPEYRDDLKELGEFIGLPVDCTVGEKCDDLVERRWAHELLNASPNCSPEIAYATKSGEKSWNNRERLRFKAAESMLKSDEYCDKWNFYGDHKAVSEIAANQTMAEIQVSPSIPPKRTNSDPHALPQEWSSRTQIFDAQFTLVKDKGNVVHMLALKLLKDYGKDKQLRLAILKKFTQLTKEAEPVLYEKPAFPSGPFDFKQRSADGKWIECQICGGKIQEALVPNNDAIKNHSKSSKHLKKVADRIWPYKKNDPWPQYVEFAKIDDGVVWLVCTLCDAQDSDTHMQCHMDSVDHKVALAEKLLRGDYGPIDGTYRF